MKRVTNKAGRLLIVSMAMVGLFGFGLATSDAVWAAGEGPGHAEAEHGGGHGDGHGGGHKTVHLDNWFSFDYGPGKTHQNGPLGFALVNFALLIYLLVRFTKKPLTGFLAGRHDKIKNDLAEAAALREKAEAKLAEINAKLNKFEQDVNQMKADVAKDAELEKQRIIAAAEAEAERLVKHAEETLAQELRRARAMIEAEAVESSLALAEERIRKNINDADRKRLNEEYISRITSSGGPN